MQMTKRVVVWFIETLSETLLLGIVLAVLLSHDPSAFFRDLSVYSCGIALLFFTTGYLFNHAARSGHLEGARDMDLSGNCDVPLLNSFRNYEHVVVWCVRAAGSTSYSGGRRVRRARLHFGRNLVSSKIGNRRGPASSRMKSDLCL